jgi:hypothetical protein
VWLPSMHANLLVLTLYGRTSKRLNVLGLSERQNVLESCLAFSHTSLSEAETLLKICLFRIKSCDFSTPDRNGKTYSKLCLLRRTRNVTAGWPEPAGLFSQMLVTPKIHLDYQLC